MALFKSAEGEHWHTDETEREYGIYYRIYEADDEDGFAVAIVTQLPDSAPIQEVSALLKEIVQDAMEEPDSALVYIEHFPPVSPDQTHRYFAAEGDARQELSEMAVRAYIIPHPLEKDFLF